MERIFKGSASYYERRFGLYRQHVLHADTYGTVAGFALVILLFLYYPAAQFDNYREQPDTGAIMNAGWIVLARDILEDLVSAGG